MKLLTVSLISTFVQIVTCIEKQKLADLHVLFPYSSLDCRISVNIERKGMSTRFVDLSSCLTKISS